MDFTKDLVALQTVTIETFGEDRQGRTLGEVILEDGQNLNQEWSRTAGVGGPISFVDYQFGP